MNFNEVKGKTIRLSDRFLLNYLPIVGFFTVVIKNVLGRRLLCTITAIQISNHDPTSLLKLFFFHSDLQPAFSFTRKYLSISLESQQ